MPHAAPFKCDSLNRVNEFLDMSILLPLHIVCYHCRLCISAVGCWLFTLHTECIIYCIHIMLLAVCCWCPCFVYSAFELHSACISFFLKGIKVNTYSLVHCLGMAFFNDHAMVCVCVAKPCAPFKIELGTSPLLPIT